MKTYRLEKLQQKITEKGIDSLIVSNIHNIRYLTGYPGEYGYLIINRLRPSFFTSSLFTEEAVVALGDKLPVFEIEENVFKTFAGLDASVLGKKIGFENESIEYAFYDKLRTAIGSGELVPAGNMVESLRYQKDDEEIDTLRKAQKVIEIAFEQVLSFVKEGIEEREIANELDYLIRKNGGDQPSFKTIIAGGANASKPHAIPSSYKIKAGDMIIFDLGAFVDGYASDMTRTVVLGKADSKTKEIYSAVFDAQEAGMNTVKSGIECTLPDKAARDILYARGYGDYFIHTTGHGIGLEVHEFPRLSKINRSTLICNMVVTVEPGVYIPGWGGIRIENMGVVRENGFENLTNTTRELIEL